MHRLTSEMSWSKNNVYREQLNLCTQEYKGWDRICQEKFCHGIKITKGTYANHTYMLRGKIRWALLNIDVCIVLSVWRGTTESAHHFCWMELERLLDNPLSCVRGEKPHWYPPKVTSHYQIMGTVHRYRQRHCIEQQYCWYVNLRLGKMHQSPASRSDIVQSFAVRLSVQRSLPEILSDSWFPLDAPYLLQGSRQ